MGSVEHEEGEPEGRASRGLRQQQRLREQSELRSQAEADRLRVVMGGIRDYAIIGGSPETGVTFFSPGAERMLGYTAEEVVGQLGAEVFHVPAEVEARAAELGVEPSPAVLAGGGTGEPREWTYVRKDGSTLPVELQVTVIPGEHGQTEFVAVARDLSDERALDGYRETREALAAELAAAPNLPMALDGAVRTVAEGMGWRVASLWFPDEAAADGPAADGSLSCHHLWQAPEVRSPEVTQAFAALRMAPEEGDGAVGQSWEDGLTVWLEDFMVVQDLSPPGRALQRELARVAQTTVLVPIGAASLGEPPLGVLQVFGPRRARNEEVVRLLEAIANAIGRHIDRSRYADALLEARDVAELANRAKGEFVSRISHELRTPLNAVLGFAQLIGHDAGNTRDRERAKQIITAGRHLTDMIDDLLDLAMVDRAQMRVSLEAVSATQVLKEVVGMMTPLINERGLALELDAHAGLYKYVEADFQRLRQVLLNLVSNAIKYNRPGGRIVLSFEDPGGGRLRFRVADTGPGIRADQRARLFRPFERLGAEAGPEVGTGLGLVLTQGLVEAMGGTLSLETEVGEGSTFIVELLQAPAPEADDREPVPGRPRWPQEEWPEATVLAIEDNPANLRLYEDIVARQPHATLISATLGQAGLTLAEAEQPDLVLLDLHLPDIDGWEILQRLHASDRTRKIPVVVVSAHSSLSLRRRFFAAGAQGFVTKPLDVGEFVTVVGQALGGRLSNDSRDTPTTDGENPW